MLHLLLKADLQFTKFEAMIIQIADGAGVAYANIGAKFEIQSIMNNILEHKLKENSSRVNIS